MKIKVSLSAPAQHSKIDLDAADAIAKKIKKSIDADSDYNHIMQMVFSAGHGTKEYLKKMTDIIASNYGRVEDQPSRSRVEKTSIPTNAVPKE